MTFQSFDGLVAAVVKRQRIPAQDRDDYMQIGRLAAWKAQQSHDASKGPLEAWVQLRVRGDIIDEQRRQLGRSTPRPRSVELLEHPVTYDPELELEPPPEPRRTCGWCRRDLPMREAYFTPNSKAKKPFDRFDSRCRACRRSYHDLAALRRRLAVLEARQQKLVRPWADVEREHLERAVKITGNVGRAARLLGIGKATLYRKLEEFAKLEPIEVPMPTDNNQYGARHSIDECRLELRKRERAWSARKGRR
ncbi:MAG: hypothetical protein KDE27_11355 [Planctomycetes bacterium]|nr:hypothetical protein [Planctomycetota bacterium]